MTSSFPPASQKQDGVLKFLGLILHRAGVDDVHAYIHDVIQRGQKALVLNLNVHCVNLALKYEWLRDFLNQAQLVFCDGDGVRWGLKWLGMNPPPKITYDRWIWQLSEFCAAKGFSLYFLGAGPGIAEKAAVQLQKQYPRLRILGTHHGYFEKTGNETGKVIEAINRCRPDILVLGFGMPLQEKWLSENWQKINAHIFLTGGAVFDWASGERMRPPQWMIALHLEWFFRFLQEPQRLFTRYFLGIPLFFMRVFEEKMKTGKGANA